MVLMLFLLVCLTAPSMLSLAAPYGLSTFGTYPKSAAFVPRPYPSYGIKKYGYKSTYSPGSFLGAHTYYPSTKTGHLIKSLKAQVAVAAQKGFAAGTQAALGAVQGGGYPAVGYAGYPAGPAGVLGHPAGAAIHGGALHGGLGIHGGAYPAVGVHGGAYPGAAVHGGAYPGAAVHGGAYPGAAVHGGAYPGAAVHGVYPGGARVEEVRVGGVPVSQEVHSVGVAKVPVSGIHGVGVAKVPVSTKTVHALGPHGLPVTKTVQQVGGVPTHGKTAAYSRLGGVHRKIGAVRRPTLHFNNRGLPGYGR